MLASDMLITLTETNRVLRDLRNPTIGFSFKLSIWGPFKGLPFFGKRKAPVTIQGLGGSSKNGKKRANSQGNNIPSSKTNMAGWKIQAFFGWRYIFQWVEV